MAPAPSLPRPAAALRLIALTSVVWACSSGDQQSTWPAVPTTGAGSGGPAPRARSPGLRPKAPARKDRRPARMGRRPARMGRRPTGIGARTKVRSPSVSRAARSAALTFFVTADTHFGAVGMVALNRQQIRDMNALPGKLYPLMIGGRVGMPRGVLIAGDLTNSGRRAQWKQFKAHYGLTGRDGLLRFPVFECTGNHDRYRFWGGVTYQVRRRHGGLLYGWTWEGVHFLNLDLNPNASARGWLRRRLRRIGPRAPVVLYFHYGLLGPFSDFWSAVAKQRFFKVIKRYNVIAIFHGHFHGDGHYRWKGIDVYNVGSPRHSRHTYAVVRIRGRRFSVVGRNWDFRRFSWQHQKLIRR